MANVNPRRECNPLCAVRRLSRGEDVEGCLVWVSRLVPYPAFTLGSTNTIVDSLHREPHPLPFVAVCPEAFREEDVLKRSACIYN